MTPLAPRAPKGAAAEVRLGAQRRIAPLDGVRGIAIALVVAYHTRYGGVIGGWLGVDLFFVLSGYLITGVLLREAQLHQRISLRSFYWRRLLRLGPAAYAMLAAYALLVVSSVHGEERARRLKAAAAAATYTYDFFAAHVQLVGLGHMWSLAIEEQFYLLWAPIVAFLIARRSPRRLVAGLISLGITLSVVTTVTEIYRNAGWTRIAFSPDTRCAGLLLGCLAAVMASNTGEARSWLASVVPWVSIATVLAALPFAAIDDPMSYSSWLPGVELAAVALIVSVSKRRSSLAARALSVRPLTWLGEVSYGLYLWHYVIMQSVFQRLGDSAATVAVAIGISLAITWLSRRVIEEPFLRLKERGAAKRHDMALPSPDGEPGPQPPPGAAPARRPATGLSGLYALFAFLGRRGFNRLQRRWLRSSCSPRRRP